MFSGYGWRNIFLSDALLKIPGENSVKIKKKIMKNKHSSEIKKAE